MVFVDCSGVGSYISLVFVDDVVGGELVVEYLIGLGKWWIVFFGVCFEIC